MRVRRDDRRRRCRQSAKGCRCRQSLPTRGERLPQNIPFTGSVTPTALRGAAEGLATVTSNCVAAYEAAAHVAAVNVRIERKVFIMKLCYGY